MITFRSAWPPGFSRSRLPLTIGVLLLIAVVLLLLDHPLSVTLTTSDGPLHEFMNGVSRWGETDWILIPSALLLLVSGGLAIAIPKRMPKLALIEMTQLYGFIFVGVGLPSLASNIVKRLVGRSRPPIFDQVGTLAFHPFAGDFMYESFPSGHTTTAFSLALVLAFLAPRWWGVGLVYAVAVGTSRMVLGVHYPSDVYGGLLLGTLGAYAVRNFFAARGWAFYVAADGSVRPRPFSATRRLARGSKGQARASR